MAQCKQMKTNRREGKARLPLASAGGVVTYLRDVWGSSVTSQRADFQGCTVSTFPEKWSTQKGSRMDELVISTLSRQSGNYLIEMQNSELLAGDQEICHLEMISQNPPVKVTSHTAH